MQNKIEHWLKKGLSILFMATYSPQLNMIEIVWRFIKDKWLQSNYYKDWETFVNEERKYSQRIWK